MTDEEIKKVKEDKYNKILAFQKSFVEELSDWLVRNNYKFEDVSQVCSMISLNSGFRCLGTEFGSTFTTEQLYDVYMLFCGCVKNNDIRTFVEFLIYNINQKRFKEVCSHWFDHDREISEGKDAEVKNVKA